MKNVYTARFYDYYGWEMDDKTKSFDTFTEAKEYFVEKLERVMQELVTRFNYEWYNRQTHVCKNGKIVL